MTGAPGIPSFAGMWGGGARMVAINEAYERLLKGDVKYRFVIDMASLN